MINMRGGRTPNCGGHHAHNYFSRPSPRRHVLAPPRRLELDAGVTFGPRRAAPRAGASRSRPGRRHHRDVHRDSTFDRNRGQFGLRQQHSDHRTGPRAGSRAGEPGCRIEWRIRRRGRNDHGHLCGQCRSRFDPRHGAGVPTMEQLGIDSIVRDIGRGYDAFLRSMFHVNLTS